MIKMKSLGKTLLQFEQILVEIQAPVLANLQAGMEYQKVQDLLLERNIISNELATLYTWKNGISNDFLNRPIEEIELFPGAIMFSFQEALARYELYTGNDCIWDKNFFPIFTDGGDHLLFNTQNDGEFGNIYLYAPSLLLSEEPEPIYDSMEYLFKTVISCIKQGAFRYNSDSTIDVDYDLKYKISAQQNPLSSYWNDYREE